MMPYERTNRLVCFAAAHERDHSWLAPDADETRAANLICRERKKKPACLEGEQAGVNAARQMCREFNLQIELSGHQDSEGETGKSGES